MKGQRRGLKKPVVQVWNPRPRASRVRHQANEVRVAVTVPAPMPSSTASGDGGRQDAAGRGRGRAGSPARPQGTRYSAMISTRRFSARPSAVWLLATGRALPNPRVVIRLALMPFETM